MLRPGYKQTEVGVIPEDWEVRCLSEICTRITDGTHDTPTPEKTGFPYLTAIHVKENLVDYNRCLFLSEKDHRVIYARCNPKRGDVLMVNIGAGVATTAFVDVDFEFSLKNVALLKPNASIVLGRYLSQSLIRGKQATIQALSSGGAQPFLSLNQIGQIQVPVPHIHEQRAITSALSDVDALLAKLDQIIAKKRDLKQAAMQQLLTGQTRLPGFSGAWEVKRLGDVFSISAGKSKSAFVAAGGRYWVVDMGSVSTDGKLVVSKATNYSGGFLNIGDLVMPKDDIGGGGIIGRVGYIDAAETYVLGDHVYRLKANCGNPLFLSYVINGYRVNSELRKKVIGTAQLGLGRRSVEEQELPFPPLEEQSAIATVLSDMDADIAVLEARRDKTRVLKQGMMQELLTGRIRLV